MDILIAAAVVVLVILLIAEWLLSIAGGVFVLLLKVGAALVAVAFVSTLVWALIDREGFRKAETEAAEKRRLKRAPVEQAKREWDARPRP